MTTTADLVVAMIEPAAPNLRTPCTHRMVRVGVACFVLIGATPASAETAPWTIEKIEGVVRYDVEGKLGEPLRASDILDPDMTLRTGATGRVRLRHGHDVVMVEPNTIVEVAEHRGPTDGRIDLRFGRIEAEIGAESTIAFETPSLLATATATRFVLHAQTIDSAVEVRTGNLSVTSLATLEDATLGPGSKTKVGPELDAISVATASSESRGSAKRKKTFLEAITALPREVARTVRR